MELLKDEWEELDRLFQSSILSRFRMVVFSDDIVFVKFGNLTSEELEVLPEIRKKLYQESDTSHRRKPDAFFEILRILLVHWFRGAGPLQLNQLGKLSGYSYPRIAASLERMESYLIRHSDRSVELGSFPGDEWFRLTAVSNDFRAPRGYRALRPRSVENLLERIMEKPARDVACGGIIGARHYLFPSIDLIFSHRIYSSVHAWSADKIDSYVRKLDPGLKRVLSGELPQVVIHNLYRPDPLFTGGDPVHFADEVECLLDLHEARMEQQALELLEHLKRQAGI